jgi:hypothetical protein
MPVTEMESPDGIDSMLRRSMAAPVPGLPPDFDQRVMRKLRHTSRGGLISIATCAGIMHGQGLAWGPIAAAILVPLALVPMVSMARRTSHRKV